jgi:hypothetical protein
VNCAFDSEPLGADARAGAGVAHYEQLRLVDVPGDCATADAERLQGGARAVRAWMRLREPVLRSDLFAKLAR